MAANQNLKQRYLLQLRQNSKLLLTEEERQYLSYALKDYRTRKSVEKLVKSLKSCLNTTVKLQLLKDVRNFVLPHHVEKYDVLIRSAFNPKHSTPNTSRETVNGGPRPASSPGKYRVVTLTNDKTEKTDLGFSICGGKDFDIGIYVSRVTSNSPAQLAGLMANDQLIEVNGISLQSIPLQSAGNLLLSLNKLKLVVKEETRMEIFAGSSEMSPWAKQGDERSVITNGSGPSNPLTDFSPAEPGFSSLHSSLNASGHSSIASAMEKLGKESQQNSISVRRNSSLLNIDNKGTERRINLITEQSKDGFIGFNIRGGCEYGLGIYVSRVDSGSLAESCGIRVGDQILDANGLSFENILHKDAVEVFKSNKNVILTVKAVGKIPGERCLIEEYSWLAPDGSIIEGKERKTDYLSSSMPSPRLRDQLNDVREIGIDTGELPWNETINLPIQAMSLSATEDIGTDPIPLELTNERIGTDEPDAPSKQMEIIITAEDRMTDDEESKVRRSPSATSLVSKKSTDSGKSERGSKSVNSGEYSDSDRSRGEDSGHLLPTAKAKRSKSFLQKQGDKLKAKFSIRSKKKAAKQNIFESELYQRSDNTREWLQYIEEKAKEILNVNDYTALMKRIKDYLEKGDIELFASNILEILDSPGKSVLLKDIRTIVFPHDIGRFDARVSKREMDNMIANGYDLGQQPQGNPESPILDGQLTEQPPKRTLVTAVQDKSGKFQLKSKTEAELLEKEKQEKTKKISKKYAKQRSILERETTMQRYKSFSNVPRPSKEHTHSWHYDPDDAIDKDLDYIPTKDTPFDPDELYSKVDKSQTRGKLDGVFTNGSGMSVDHSVQSGKKTERAMSDIVEDQEYSVPDINRNGTSNGNVKNENDDEDDDDGDYTPIKPILDSMKKPPEIRLESSKPREITVAIPKEGKSLGISISGGRGSTQQPEIRIETVYPGGAVAEVGLLQAGYQLLSVDGNSLKDVHHNEAVDLIRRSFGDRSKTTMEVVAIQV